MRRFWAGLVSLMLVLCGTAVAEDVVAPEGGVTMQLTGYSYAGSVLRYDVLIRPQGAVALAPMGLEAQAPEGALAVAVFADTGYSGWGIAERWEATDEGLLLHGAAILKSGAPDEFALTLRVVLTDAHASTVLEAPEPVVAAIERTGMARTSSFDVDVQVGGYHLTGIQTESTPGDLWVCVDYEAADGAGLSYGLLGQDGALLSTDSAGRWSVAEEGTPASGLLLPIEGIVPQTLGLWFAQEGQVLWLDTLTGETQLEAYVAGR